MDLINGTPIFVECIEVGAKRVKKTPTGKKLKKFFASKDFQDYCNCPENGIRNGSIVWIVKGGYWCDMRGVRGDAYYEFSIVPQNEGKYLYLAKTFLNKPAENETSIGFSESFLIYQNSEGKWIPECLWNNHEWMKNEVVKSAFEEISFFRGYKILERLDIYNVKYSGIDTFAWGQKIVDKKGKERYLFCLLDSGKIDDLSSDKLELTRLKGNMIRTKHNWFRFWGTMSDVERI